MRAIVGSPPIAETHAKTLILLVEARIQPRSVFRGPRAKAADHPFGAVAEKAVSARHMRAPSPFSPFNAALKIRSAYALALRASKVPRTPSLGPWRPSRPF